MWLDDEKKRERKIEKKSSWSSKNGIDFRTIITNHHYALNHNQINFMKKIILIEISRWHSFCIFKRLATVDLLLLHICQTFGKFKSIRDARRTLQSKKEHKTISRYRYVQVDCGHFVVRFLFRLQALLVSYFHLRKWLLQRCFQNEFSSIQFYSILKHDDMRKKAVIDGRQINNIRRTSILYHYFAGIPSAIVTSINWLENNFIDWDLCLLPSVNCTLIAINLL